MTAFLIENHRSLGSGPGLPGREPLRDPDHDVPHGVAAAEDQHLARRRASECFLAHAGSASMASGLRAGAFPSKVTVPVTVDAATATPGQTNTATSPAASHNLFPVPRMLSSLVIANLVSVVTVDAALSAHIHAIGATLHRILAIRASLARPPPPSTGNSRSDAQTFSNASDSASLGSRSGTSACRRISQLAAATKHPPTATNAATSRSDGRSPSGWSVGMTCQ